MWDRVECVLQVLRPSAVLRVRPTCENCDRFIAALPSSIAVCREFRHDSVDKVSFQNLLSRAPRPIRNKNVCPSKCEFLGTKALTGRALIACEKGNKQDGEKVTLPRCCPCSQIRLRTYGYFSCGPLLQSLLPRIRNWPGLFPKYADAESGTDLRYSRIRCTE